MTKKRSNTAYPDATKSVNDQEAALVRVTEKLTRTMEKTRIAEYVDYLEHPWKLLWMNFLVGIARGLGGTIGLALVLGIVIFFLQKIIMLNLPVLGDFISDFILMIQDNLHYLNNR